MNLFNFIACLFALPCFLCKGKFDINSTSVAHVFGSLFLPGEISRGVIPLLNRKVFRGRRVTIQEHPYLVSIRRQYSHYLTGTLLTKNIIITVAHPIYKVPTYDLRVVVGENYSDRGSCLYTVLIVIIHQEFSPYNLQNDIALIRTYEDITYKLSVRSIAILPPVYPLSGEMAFITGWGRCDRTGRELCLPRSSIFYRGEIYDPMLRTVKVVIKSKKSKYCELFYADSLIKDGMICIGEDRSEDLLSPCMAVPGAPLVVNARLAAIQSWGFACAFINDHPIVYTSIQHYQPWLLHNIPLIRNISREELTKIFAATKAEVMCRWLVETRHFLPVLGDPKGDYLVQLPVDTKLSRLAGTIYDVRDFMYDSKYHNAKYQMYRALRNSYQATVRHKPKYNRQMQNVESFLKQRVLDEIGLVINNGSLQEKIMT